MKKHYISCFQKFGGSVSEKLSLIACIIITIPKLELMATVIAVRLKNIVISEVTLQIDSIYFWTDSSTVLQWIRADSKKQQVFVANRVAEIMDGSTVDQWRHVPGHLNPADLGTRGLTATEFTKSEWLTGPAWLHDKDSWPQMFEIEKEEPEENALLTIDSFKVDWTRFGSFVKLHNTIAWILKWRYNDIAGGLPVDLIGRSERVLWKLVQAECFGEDMFLLETGGNFSAKSKLLSLCPFLDSFSSLRAKGRLRKADIDFNAKHPLILDAKHYVVLKLCHCFFPKIIIAKKLRRKSRITKLSRELQIPIPGS